MMAGVLADGSMVAGLAMAAGAAIVGVAESEIGCTQDVELSVYAGHTHSILHQWREAAALFSPAWQHVSAQKPHRGLPPACRPAWH